MRAMLIASGFAAAVLVTTELVVAQSPGTPPYVRVPHRSGDVYVPLDAAGNPVVPAPAVPGSPPAPAAPATPAVPSMTAEGGALAINGAPAEASVYVNGQRVGPGTTVSRLALSPGAHRIDVLVPNTPPIRLTVEIGSRAAAPRGGYFVVPKP